jgi:hypothetical protein
LYLTAADLTDLAEISDRINAADVPEGFVWLIEGPVDSADGDDFDITRESEADLEVVNRLADTAERIGARAVNIHAIAPSSDVARLSLDSRARLLDKAVEFLRSFVQAITAAGAIPTVENMPPVLRMRRSDFAFTPIGMTAEDLRCLVDRVDGLRVLVDTSHAGLFVNARRLPPDPAYSWSEPLKKYLDQLPEQTEDLLGYVASVPNLENAQVSNAAGLLGEGLAYTQGDFDLDPVIRWLGARARHIVTETIEANNDDAALMRDALRHMRMALG